MTLSEIQRKYKCNYSTAAIVKEAVADLEAQLSAVKESLNPPPYKGDWSGEIVDNDCVLLKNKNGADGGMLMTMDAYDDLIKFCKQTVTNESIAKAKEAE